MLLATLPTLMLQGSALLLQVDVDKVGRTISPTIYGDNQPDYADRSKYLTFARQGGNRLTAYNWENNASNAGEDWFNQNDDYLGGGDLPGEVPRAFVAAAHAHGLAALVTVPCDGYVAADKNGGGDVNQTPDYLNVRFRVSQPLKGAPFTDPPVTSDRYVYQDEFVWWLKRHLDTKRPVWFSLDNEPDLWYSTHPRITPTQPTYASYIAKAKAYAQAIKSQWSNTLVFGPASYGWNGYVNLQNAPDANGRFFLDTFLQEFRTLQDQTGKRFLDVLDLHWYPEATGNGTRITQDSTDPAVVAARVQAPRSLWDPSYTESSWITQWSTNGPICLIPRVRSKIDADYPGTKLSFSEWNYGGGGDISGGVAVADVLGVFGREGVFAASYWHMRADESYAYGGFDCYRNFDGKGAHFGDQSLGTSTADVSKVTVYASKDSTDRSAITVVAINKQTIAQAVSLRVGGTPSIRAAKAYRLASGSSRPVGVAVPAFASGTANFTLPAMSVTILRLVQPTAAR